MISFDNVIQREKFLCHTGNTTKLSNLEQNISYNDATETLFLKSNVTFLTTNELK